MKRTHVNYTELSFREKELRSGTQFLLPHAHGQVNYTTWLVDIHLQGYVNRASIY